MFEMKAKLTASDITHDSDVEVLNPELKIATVSKGGHLKNSSSC